MTIWWNDGGYQGAVCIKYNSGLTQAVLNKISF